MTDKYLKQWVKPEVLAQPAYRVKSTKCHIKLNQNESPWDWPEELKQEITERIANKAWSRYPELIPEKLKTKLATTLGVDSDQIVIGKGSNEVLQALFTATLREGDSICTLSPTFAVYQLLAEQRGVRVVTANLDESFQVDESDLIEKAKQVKDVIITNPNSPTATLISLELIEQIAKVTNGIVVIDEAYVDFSGVTALSLIDDYPNVVITRTFSKAFALAGFRLGYGVMNPELATEIQKCFSPFNIDIPSLVASEVLLDHLDLVEKRVKKIINERNNLIEKLNSLDGVKALPSHSNFFLLRTSLGPEATFDGLARQGILIRDVSSYPGCSELVRITVGTPEENQALIEAINGII